jgi:archaellum biogenesis protein FlaJ (TadC family)
MFMILLVEVINGSIIPNERRGHMKRSLRYIFALAIVVAISIAVAVPVWAGPDITGP